MKAPVERLQKLNDTDLIMYCSNHAKGNQYIHLLCDRLTQANMKLKNTLDQVMKVEEALKCEYH